MRQQENRYFIRVLHDNQFMMQITQSTVILQYFSKIAQTIFYVEYQLHSHIQLQNNSTSQIIQLQSQDLYNTIQQSQFISADSKGNITIKVDSTHNQYTISLNNIKQSLHSQPKLIQIIQQINSTLDQLNQKLQTASKINLQQQIQITQYSNQSIQNQQLLAKYQHQINDLKSKYNHLQTSFYESQQKYQKLIKQKQQIIKQMKHQLYLIKQSSQSQYLQQRSRIPTKSPQKLNENFELSSIKSVSSISSKVPSLPLSHIKNKKMQQDHQKNISNHIINSQKILASTNKSLNNLYSVLYIIGLIIICELFVLFVYFKFPKQSA